MNSSLQRSLFLSPECRATSIRRSTFPISNGNPPFQAVEHALPSSGTSSEIEEAYLACNWGSKPRAIVRGARRSAHTYTASSSRNSYARVLFVIVLRLKIATTADSFHLTRLF